MKLDLITTVATAALLSLATTAQAETFNLRIGAGHPLGSLWVGSIKDFFMAEVAKRVEERTDHSITWTEGFGGTVCKLGECLEAVESGLLDIADLEAAFEPAKLMAANFSYFVPFGATDPVVAQKAAADVYESTPELTALFERYNQIYLGASVVANYGLVTTFEWGTVDQLKGQKIAAAGPNIPWLESTGVVGVQSTLNEAYTSFQTGVYEGWIMFADAVVSFKLNEVTKQFVDMGFGSVHTPLLTINKDTFDSLPPEVRDIVVEVGREWGAETARRIGAKQDESVKTLTATLKVIDPDPAVRKAWAEALPNIPKLRSGEISAAGQPGEVVYKYVEALKAAGHEFPRDWAAER
ncbi:C4-dicarboxylate TRAP transporter substrate-binding protein [Mesorhizobium sp. 1B3]|uniref:C4-dicarboxylate TRAP transporter substrate-binding protein n=1 Tax=Mesorhizobium sp. 1B3 TaxID=3243599 RepID=UPI003D965250